MRSGDAPTKATSYRVNFSVGSNSGEKPRNSEKGAKMAKSGYTFFKRTNKVFNPASKPSTSYIKFRSRQSHNQQKMETGSRAGQTEQHKRASLYRSSGRSRSQSQKHYSPKIKNNTTAYIPGDQRYPKKKNNKKKGGKKLFGDPTVTRGYQLFTKKSRAPKHSKQLNMTTKPPNSPIIQTKVPRREIRNSSKTDFPTKNNETAYISRYPLESQIAGLSSSNGAQTPKERPSHFPMDIDCMNEFQLKLLKKKINKKLTSLTQTNNSQFSSQKNNRSRFTLPTGKKTRKDLVYKPKVDLFLSDEVPASTQSNDQNQLSCNTTTIETIELDSESWINLKGNPLEDSRLMYKPSDQILSQLEPKDLFLKKKRNRKRKSIGKLEKPIGLRDPPMPASTLKAYFKDSEVIKRLKGSPLVYKVPKEKHWPEERSRSDDWGSGEKIRDLMKDFQEFDDEISEGQESNQTVRLINKRIKEMEIELHMVKKN